MTTRMRTYMRKFFVILILFYGMIQLGCSGHKTDSVSALVDKLNNGDYQAQIEALDHLRRLGPNGEPAVPTLVKMLEDKNSTIRASVASTLGAIGPQAKKAVPALITKLKDRDNFVRVASAHALASIGSKEEKTISAIKDAMVAEPDGSDIVDIATALIILAPECEDAISAINNILLKDEDQGNRSVAAAALGKIKTSKIKSTVPALISALKDKDEDVRESSAQSLGFICEDSETVVPALIDTLNNDEASSARLLHFRRVLCSRSQCREQDFLQGVW